MPGEWFGPLIRRRRYQLGLTQFDVAIAAGVSTCTVSSWETGRQLPRISSRAGIAAALNLPVSILQVALLLSHQIRNRRGGIEEAVCGTVGGYRKHYKRGEKPCDACRKKHSEEDRERRKRKGGKPFKPAVCGTASGRRKHYRNGEKPCDACRKKHNEEERNRSKRKGEKS
jgi:transcriptional regulator with XRE-family HTH domain